MKIKNNNEYKIMYGLEFIGAHEVKEIKDNKIIDLLLKQPNVEEFIGLKDAKKIEEENKELKAKLEEQELKEAKQKADELGIKYAKNISLKTLLAKIEELENKGE